MNKYWRKIIEIKYITDGPTPRSYWIVPDLLAAGAYPGKQGSGTKNVIPEVLEQLLESGINTFINLTEDLGGGDKLELYDPFLPSSCIVERFPVKDVVIAVELIDEEVNVVVQHVRRLITN